jgi:malate dehydrogenase (oxaloacetate-decarboxylating)
MKIAAAHAIASEVADSELREEYIIPGIFKSDVASKVAARVREVASKAKC